MNIAGLQKMTLLDYPGRVGCTVFLSGCNFRCPFCHNSGLLGHGESAMTDRELLSFLKKRQGLLDGVCVTGGEPTLSPGLPGLLREIRSLGYDIKLDTNGTRPEVLKALVAEGLVQYVAMDIKNSPARYALTAAPLPPSLREGDREAVEGVSHHTNVTPPVTAFAVPAPSERGPGLAPIEQSIRFLLSGAVDYELRTTVVQPLHDVDSIRDMGIWLSSLGGKPERFFLQNYVCRDSVLRPDGLTEVDTETLKKMLRSIEPYTKSAAIRGE